MADDPSTGLAQFHADLSGAQAALSAFARGPAQDAMNVLDDCIKRTGMSISYELERAAKNGEFSFKRLAKTVLEEMAKIALSQIFKNADVGASSGKSDNGLLQAAASALTVNFNVGPGADSNDIRRNHTQIAAQVAQAAAYGRRNQ